MVVVPSYSLANEMGAMVEPVRSKSWYGTATVVIRRSHHIGCLAAFLQQATDRGMMLIVASSDPEAELAESQAKFVPVRDALEAG